MQYVKAKTLDHSLELIIPDKDAGGHKIDAINTIEELGKMMATSFGGVRERKEKCIWVESEGNMIYENAIILQSFFAVDKLPAMTNVISKFILILANSLGQAEMAFKIDGKLNIVSADSESDNSGSKFANQHENQPLNYGGSGHAK